MPKGWFKSRSRVFITNEVNTDVDSVTVSGAIDVNVRDGGGTALTSTLVGSDQALDVNVVQVTGGDPVVTISPVADNPEVFEDSNFVTGDSPANLDVNASLGRNANQVIVWNDGPGDFTVSASTDGAVFGGAHTMKQGEVYSLSNISIDTIRISWVSKSAYRVVAI